MPSVDQTADPAAPRHSVGRFVRLWVERAKIAKKEAGKYRGFARESSGSAYSCHDVYEAEHRAVQRVYESCILELTEPTEPLTIEQLRASIIEAVKDGDSVDAFHYAIRWHRESNNQAETRP